MSEIKLHERLAEKAKIKAGIVRVYKVQQFKKNCSSSKHPKRNEIDLDLSA